MSIKHNIKKIIERGLNIKIHKKMPFAYHPFEDIKTILPDYDFQTIFDIGANVGLFSIESSKNFPNVTIHSFEPSSKSYKTLKNNTLGISLINCHQLAFANEIGELTMNVNGDTTMNKLQKEEKDGGMYEKVKVETLDSFCETNSINHISFLKIDTEGFDLEVLKGSLYMLKNKQVDFIQTEVGMNLLNNYHVSLEKTKSFLEDNGYVLFGIYHQVQEWIEKKPYLRVADAVFIKKSLADTFAPVKPSWY